MTFRTCLPLKLSATLNADQTDSLSNGVMLTVLKVTRHLQVVRVVVALVLVLVMDQL